ncbi:Hpt domain-containing response regulator [Pseudomonas sp. GZD-222]|uniref:Hpt domain-containing response regulator n=1 Tax=Pseudomonas sp. GZD-222 TaxID=3404805 RepID=UPI003BB51006
MNAVRKKYVLLVDDDPVHRSLLEQYFVSASCEVSCAGSGVQALQLINTAPVDLVITDLNMPGMSGNELARFIRKLEANVKGKKCTIIGITANEEKDLKDRCIADGMDSLLIKPIDFTQINGLEIHSLPASDPMVDFGAISVYTKDAEQVRIILNTLKASLEEDIETLKEIDPGLLLRLAHRVQGAARVVGAKTLETSAKEYEEAALRNFGMQNDSYRREELVRQISKTILRIDHYLYEEQIELFQ